MTAGTSGKWTDLKVRTATAAILIPAVLFAVWTGGILYNLLAVAMGVLMAREWTTIAIGGSISQFFIHVAAVIVAGLLPTIIGVGPTLAAIFGLTVAANVLLGKTAHRFWARIGVPYASVPVLALVMLRNDPNYGFLAVLWVICIVWIADIMAYFAGRLIGGPKLAPTLSPKKTWAGLGGAIAGAIVASATVDLFFLHTRLWPLAAVAGVLAVWEQTGDIFESSLKRAYNIKDSGTLFPGHGGMIDRVDGLVAVAVAAWIIGSLRNSHLAATGLLNW